MDSTPVNWESLDALVIDFARSENLVEEESESNSSVTASSSIQQTNLSSSLPPSSPCISSSSYHSRLIIRQIRRCIEQGDVDSAVDLLRSHAPFLLEDGRLFFRLQKQKFVELLRKGTIEARNLAIECTRKVLAPCALDAYPEAYEEFKHVLLAFIYEKDDTSSPVAYEWAENRRFEIAGLISSVLRAHLHVYDPVFSMTLRYLISIHKSYCLREGISSPVSDLTERLLLEERDPPAVPLDSSYEAPPFDEVDIQALAHAVELTRQGAIDSLKFVKGDLFEAFQNELCRMKLDLCMLDELIREYCVYRGIVDFNKEARCSNDSSAETCSTSVRASSPERAKRKRWRGHVDSEDYPAVCKQYEFALGIKDLASKGMTTQVVNEINSFDPNFFSLNRSFLFHIKKVEFLKLVSSGDNSSALKLACKYLGPLAAADPDLLQPLKDTLVELLVPNQIKTLPLGSLATSLHVAVAQSMGIEEPQLMKMMRAVLYTHSEWFKLQMCKDRFESVLRIDCLKEIQPQWVCVARSNGDSCTQASTCSPLDDAGSTCLVSGSSVDETAVLKVMEFLALPRADAIHLLAQYNGNAETVIQQIFA